MSTVTKHAEDASRRIVTLAQAQATIEAVRVNGKAMTLALFDQLEWAYPGKFIETNTMVTTKHEGRLTEYDEHIYQIDEGVELWGYVRRMYTPTYFSVKALKPRMTKHVLFTRQGKLYKTVGPVFSYPWTSWELGQALAWREATDTLPHLFIAV
jgi:hypothetical protein